MNKNYTVIEDLTSLPSIEDNNYIIVEDKEDTKKATILDLKKSFSGDYKAVSDRTFYSSKKIEEYMSDIRRQLSGLASDEELKTISNRIEDIIAEAGTGKDSEIIDARDGEATLSSRLARDKYYNEDKYMKKVNKIIEGKEVSTGNTGYVNIYLKNMTNETANIILKSKNILDINNELNVDTDDVVYTATGFTYQQLTVDNFSVSLNFTNSIPKGKYYFFANAEYDEFFLDKGDIILAVKNSRDESAYTEFTYNQSGKFEFEAPKAFNEIKLIFNADKFSLNSVVEYKNIMLTVSDKYEDAYIPYEYIEVPINKDETIKGYNKDYDITSSDANASVVVEYYDNFVTTESMNSAIKELQAVLIDNRDKCGLIEDYGKYLFFDHAVCKTPTSCRLSYDNDKYMRNGTPSLKMIFAEDVEVNPIFDVEMTEYIENIESVSLVFYIDKTTSYYFTDSNPIMVALCSDSINEPDMVNYLYIKLSKDELVQGWNIIKKNINEFSTNGIPNAHGIKYVRVDVSKSAGLDGKSMYFNSVVFNQKMKPTVLLAFDGIYEEGIGYTYPYLTTRDIPATILSNNRTTFGSVILNAIVNLRAKFGWDLGQYGCNPNKELLTYDDNPREQYLGLKNAKEWLQANLVYEPISYSAPYGNLRPITVPLLKDMGYKIAKTDSIGYCNFFDPKFDFAIPMHLLSNNTTEEEVIAKIQYAIDNNCSICLYTNNVTNYGNEADSKKTLFESVVKFILDNKDKITPMSFSEFYNKCNS